MHSSPLSSGCDGQRSAPSRKRCHSPYLFSAFWLWISSSTAGSTGFLETGVQLWLAKWLVSERSSQVCAALPKTAFQRASGFSRVWRAILLAVLTGRCQRFRCRKLARRRGRLEAHAMLCGPKGSAERSVSQCGACGRESELFELPGRKEKYCFECSADVATSILLATEIDAANNAGEDSGVLVAEFLQIGRRLLARAQLQ